MSIDHYQINIQFKDAFKFTFVTTHFFPFINFKILFEIVIE